MVVCCSSIKFEAVWTWVGNFEQRNAFFFAIAADGELLLGLPKVQVLRNDKREGEKSILFAFVYTHYFSS